MDTSPTPTPNETCCTIPQKARTFTARPRPQGIAARWGVKPKYMDYEKKLPKLWMESEINGNLELTPWALTWFDKHPESLKTSSEEYEQSYKICINDPRVERFVDASTEAIFQSFTVQPRNERDQKSGEAIAIKDVQQTPFNDHTDDSSVTTITEEDSLNVESIVYPGFESRLYPPHYPTAPGLHPVTTWGEVPDDELDPPPSYLHYHDDDALFSAPPKKGEPELLVRGLSSGPTSSGIRKPGRRGMPVWACSVDVRYRPRPWGLAQRMPEDYYKARFRVGAHERLPANVKPGIEAQKKV
ncbi:hypothetical protein N0V83_009196 [Neocucurbitaria cava]|uniref:Uncharacterized protein n=1 Tax=Neocucurbitaria cava TaxID=798079 RepID=A0A9W8Y3I2_9PLEO|nr:hypothetical protein N0V83_009196 [Neocucurbitaria cava]